MQYDEELNRLKQELNGIKFKECEDVLIGDAIHYHLLDYIQKNSNKRRLVLYIWYIIAIVRRLLVNNYDYKINNGSHSLFIFSSSYAGREDFVQTFLQLIELAPKSNAIICYPKKRTIILSNLKYLPRELQDLHQRSNSFVRCLDIA